MTSPDEETQVDARGNQITEWFNKIVETPHGIGKIVNVKAGTVTVNHEFPTHGNTTREEYPMNHVAVVESPYSHPAYKEDSPYRKKSVETLETMQEPIQCLSVRSLME